jgi:hypothetical protein
VNKLFAEDGKTMSDTEKCIICGSAAGTLIDRSNLYHHCFYKCPNCGNFYVSYKFYHKKPQALEEVRRHAAVISGYIREMNEIGHHSKCLTSTLWVSILNDELVPKTFDEKAMKLLQYVERRMGRTGEPVNLYHGEQPALCYASSKDEVLLLIGMMTENGYLKPQGDGFYILTEKGRDFLDGKEIMVIEL